MKSDVTKRILSRSAIWIFIVFELVLFTVLGEFMNASAGSFMDPGNLLLLIKQAAPIGIIAVGMTVVMVNGNIDLSVGAVFAIAGIIMLDVMTWPMFSGWGDGVIFVAWALALLAGALLGALNGLIVWKTGVDAFIVTLGAMLGYRGLVFMFNGENPTSHLNWTLIDFAEAQFLGLHTASWFLLGTVLIVWLITRYTVHGRNAYAIGNNREAAKNAGIRVGPHMLINFTLIGFLAALSAVVFTSGTGSVNPNDGMLYELWVITAVVLGGTKLAGGAGSIIGTLGGVLAIQLLRNGLGYVGADTSTVNLVIGLILIFVLYIDRQINVKGAQELKV